ncbi:hypothetical protein [Vreelandella sp. TE19]
MLDALEHLIDDAPSFESVINREPDLVISAFEWMVGPAGVVGTPEMFDDAGVAFWTLPTEVLTPAHMNTLFAVNARLVDDPEGGAPLIAFQRIH